MRKDDMFLYVFASRGDLTTLMEVDRCFDSPPEKRAERIAGQLKRIARLNMGDRR